MYVKDHRNNSKIRKKESEKGSVNRFNKLVEENGNPSWIIIYWKRKARKRKHYID
jgi:hypothetical protein